MLAWLCDLSQSNLYIHFAKQNGGTGDAAGMQRWLQRAAQAHWLAWMRPDWWWLRAFGGRKTSPTQSTGALSAASRSIDLLSQLVGSHVLHGLLRLVGRLDAPRMNARA